MEDFFVPCLMGGFILFGIIISLITRQNNEALKKSWKALDRSNNLEFVPGDLFTAAYVWGTFRGNGLTLDTFPKRYGKSSQTHTRILLTVNKTQRFEARKRDESVESTSVEHVVEVLTTRFPLRGRFKVIAGGQQLYYEQRGVENDIKYLQKLFDLLANLVETYGVVALGGEVVPHLLPIATDKTNKLRSMAVQLLNDIADETTRRLKYNATRSICSNCLVRCGPHKVRLSRFNSITYYGCRVCGQSRRFLNVDAPVVVTLDNQMETEYVHQNGTLRVNWLTRQTLFDFDTVEIVQATDEDIERFAVQAGNDTDAVRKPHYKIMPLIIAARCELSENSKRVLERIFGMIEVKDLPSNSVEETFMPLRSLRIDTL